MGIDSITLKLVETIVLFLNIQLRLDFDETPKISIAQILETFLGIKFGFTSSFSRR